MRFITMTAKYPGMCRRCQTGINPGTRMRYGGRGRTYHLAAECPASMADAAIPAHLAEPQHISGWSARLANAGERSMEAEMDRAYAGEARY